MKTKQTRVKIVLIVSAILMCSLSFWAGRLSLQAANNSQASLETKSEEEGREETNKVSLTLQPGEDNNLHGIIEGEATIKSGEEVIVTESGKFSVSPGTVLTAYNDLFEFTSTLPAIQATTTANCPTVAGTTTVAPAVPVTPQATGQFVASKNSTKYHPIDSGTAKRIKDENKVFFQTKAEAENAGFEAGASVK